MGDSIILPDVRMLSVSSGVVGYWKVVSAVEQLKVGTSHSLRTL